TPPVIFYLYPYTHLPHPALHSFPTRRSSDLRHRARGALPASDQTGPRGRRADHLRGRRLTVPDTRRRVIHGPAPRRVAAARPDAPWTGRSLGGSVPSTASGRPPAETRPPPSS